MATTLQPYSVALDANAARELFHEYAVLLLLDAPEGLVFGIAHQVRIAAREHTRPDSRPDPMQLRARVQLDVCHVRVIADVLAPLVPGQGLPGALGA